MKQSVGGNVHAEVNSPDAGMLLTDNELVYINVSGMQRARLTEIAKVARENGELVISSSERPLIRGAIKADKEVLSNFFSQVRQVAAWSRERRTVILDSPNAIPMDSSFIGRAPDAPVQQQMPDPIAQMPVTPPPPRPMVTVSQSLGGEVQSPYQAQPSRGDLGRGAPVRNEDVIAQDRPRVFSSTVKLSESRNEPARLEYAGFWVRFFAYLIDLILVGVATGILTLAFGGLGQSTTLGFDDFASLVLTWLYFALLESGDHRGTLGKMALGLSVGTLENERLNFGQATVRYFARLACALPLLVGYAILPASTTVLNNDMRSSVLILAGISLFGTTFVLGAYIMAAFTAKKQALHDLIAKTLVLKK
jgi:uncharacterized RDD family membrane protein YckC